MPTDYAPIRRRFAALVIDSIIFLVAGVVLAVAVGGLDTDIGDDGFAGVTLEGLPLLVWLFGVFAYYVVFETLFGATVGKAFLGIRVVTEYGEPVSWGAAVVRTLLRAFDCWFFYAVAGVTALLSMKRQRIGDHVAKTIVVRS